MSQNTSVSKSCRLATRHLRKLLAEVHVTLHAALERSVEDSTGLNANETGRKNTRVTDTFGAERDDVSVWELIGLNLVGTFRGRFELIVVVNDI